LIVERLTALLTTSAEARILTLLAAASGFFVCFVFMQWRIGRWRKKYYEKSLACSAIEERQLSDARHYQQTLALVQDNETRTQTLFNNIADTILGDKVDTLTAVNQDRISSLLHPLREQINSFAGRVETIFTEETKDRASLKQELAQMRELNRRLNDEATQLTRAISGNRATQGAWGEMILERLLEQSGLRNGHEYETQTGWRGTDNRLFKPDVIVHLPDGKDIIIDSKVSLSAWSRYVNGESEGDRASGMADHIKALQVHLKTLAEKDYSSLPQLRSLDMVLMFVPIDAAFMSAVEAYEGLIAEMHSRKVLIVTPTTLLATLRTIKHFWQKELQNRNALEIAERAGALYDKLKSYVDDMERLGRQLDSCRISYDQAMTKLATGRGSLVDRARVFPELGVKVKTEIAAPVTADPPRH
jgi:DNA recombination protein RmuC